MSYVRNRNVTNIKTNIKKVCSFISLIIKAYYMFACENISEHKNKLANPLDLYVLVEYSLKANSTNIKVNSLILLSYF